MSTHHLWSTILQTNCVKNLWCKQGNLLCGESMCENIEHWWFKILEKHFNLSTWALGRKQENCEKYHGSDIKFWCQQNDSCLLSIFPCCMSACHKFCLTTENSSRPLIARIQASRCRVINWRMLTVQLFRDMESVVKVERPTSFSSGITWQDQAAKYDKTSHEDLLSLLHMFFNNKSDAIIYWYFLCLTRLLITWLSTISIDRSFPRRGPTTQSQVGDHSSSSEDILLQNASPTTLTVFHRHFYFASYVHVRCGCFIFALTMSSQYRFDKCYLKDVPYFNLNPCPHPNLSIFNPSLARNSPAFAAAPGGLSEYLGLALCSGLATGCG